MDFKDIIEKIRPFKGNFSNLYWGVALGGEIGEIDALFKEEYNKGTNIKDRLPSELADVFNYIVLIAKTNEIDLEQAILEKIDSARKKWIEEMEEIVMLDCDSGKEHCEKTLKLLNEAKIPFKFIDVSEDKYEYPYIGWRGMQWLGIEGVEQFIKYYKKHQG